MRIIAWRTVEGSDLRERTTLYREAEDGLFANLSLYSIGDPSADHEEFYKEIYPHLTAGSHSFFHALRCFFFYLTAQFSVQTQTADVSLSS